MWLKTYKKEATQNKHVKTVTKQTRIWGFWVIASRMLEQVYLRMNLAFVHRLDHTLCDFLPFSPIKSITIQ